MNNIIEKASEAIKGNKDLLALLFGGSADHIHKKSNDSDSQILTAIKLAYRKHALDDPSIAWGELQDALWDVICNEMGDDAAVDWANMHRTK